MNDSNDGKARERPARRSAATVIKDMLLLLATPFISLAYLALFPFIGLVKLVRAVAEARRAASH